MHQVLSNTSLTPNVSALKVVAPRIAEIRQPGQFVIVHKGSNSERIPLTIADADPVRGTIILVIQAVGKSTQELVALEPGESIHDIVGPLGKPTELIESGHAVCVGGGVGTAVVHPIAQGLHRLGVSVTSIIGGRSREWVILEEELRKLGEVIVCTDDGSYGRHGFVTEALKDVLATGGVDAVYAVGPVPMMRAVSEMTRPSGIHTIVSLNPIMIDGTGMCGGCRVSIGGETKFACVDGPEFDGHLVDFRQLSDRLSMYRPYEQEALAPHEGECRIGLQELHPTLASKDSPVQISLSGSSLPPQSLTPEALHFLEGPITPKERMKIDRQKMPEQDSFERAANFNEVNLGFTEQLALLEARRCLQCKSAKCIPGCPVMVDIPRFIKYVAEGNLPAAAESLLGDNTLPAVTGRVCPQETQCEELCVRGNKGAPVAVGHLERFVADWARQQAGGIPVKQTVPSGKRIAVVGSGPGGLTAAGELVKYGHQVVIYEALHSPGGVLLYGIPEFRLPKDIVRQEVDRLVQQGVKIECNVIIGKTYTLGELRQRFDAIFIANGAGLPVFMNVPGENLKGVYSANEYLTRVNLMAAYDFPRHDTPVLKGKNVAVVGGGNVAIDAVRTGKRLGADQSTIVYRRSKKEMPARIEEIHHAEEEGIHFEFLTAPVEVLGSEEGWVSGLKCIRMELGEPDASGRRRPIPVPGSEFVIPCDIVVVAVGTRANPLLTSTCPDLKLNKWGNIAVDENGMTSIPGVFAGGDIVRGAATVILAMGDGKRAAQVINRYLESLTSPTLEDASVASVS
jgi:glutamate synthase (NADPH/NADH) small chain